MTQPVVNEKDRAAENGASRSEQRVVGALEECGLCGGAGKRKVRRPPYWDITDVEEVICEDCHGTGRRERAQRPNGADERRQE